MTEIADQVPRNGPAAREIGFAIPERYNCSRILFDNLAAGRGDRVALTGPAGTRTYSELCADASRWGHGLPRWACRAATASCCSSTTPRPIRRRSSARCAPVLCRC